MQPHDQRNNKRRTQQGASGSGFAGLLCGVVCDVGILVELCPGEPAGLKTEESRKHEIGRKGA